MAFVLAKVASLVGIACSAGCVFGPTPEYPLDNPDIRCAVGDARSCGPIRPGVTLREQVRDVLGAPQTTSSDDSTWYYERVMGIHFVIIFPPLYPAAGPLMQRPYYLRLRFRNDGIVASYELRRGDKSDAAYGYALITPSSVADAEFESAELVSASPMAP